MVARAASGYILPDLGELEHAAEQCELALTLARRLGARRFEASSLRHLARVTASLGRRADAIALLEQAYAISRESGIGATRERVNRQLCAWRRCGILAVDEGRLAILDRGALRALAEQD